jgi:diguanylate cyclase (GGDEF)-like protein
MSTTDDRPGPEGNGHSAGRHNGAEPSPAAERDPPTFDADQTASDADQTASDADQTAADADQTTSDSDQTTSDSDQASSNRDGVLSESDQDAADRDQQVADRDLARGPQDDAHQRAHEISRMEREGSAAERDTTALLRSEATAERFDSAVRRDETARLRDLAAEARDRAAVVRDRLAPRGGAGAMERAQAASDRARAAKDRERAAADRQQAAQDRELARQALLETHVDELTGTYRRGMGNIALQAEIGRARRADGRLVLAFVDVDRLKDLNDREGHAAGDALLVDVVTTIRSKLRSYDPMVRFGGDEFVCTLADADLDDARARFDEIQAALGQTRSGCSISVGFAKLEPGDTLHDLTARADAALYEVKRPTRDAAAAAEVKP